MSKQDIEKRLGFAAQGVKTEMAASFEDRQRAAGYKWQVRYTKQLGKTDSNNAMEIDETLAFATESAARKWADTMIKKGWYKGTSGTPEKVLTAKVVPFARPGTKAKMALTIYTVGAKNACYEALANLKALAQLASETNSGWDFHVTVMTDHVKDAIARMETKPTQAATDLDKAVDTLGMLKKIEPKRLNDIQKGSLKQLIGYVAKSLRDARANIKVVTTASRLGAKAKFEKEYVLWGLPKGETDAIHQQVLSTQAKTPAQMEDVKKRAAAAGWHSFRVQILDLSKPYKGFARPGAKAKMAIRAGNFVKFKYIVAPGDKEFRGKVVRIEGKYAIVDFGITTPAYQEWVQPGQMTRRILVDELVTASRPGAKASVDFDLAESCWEGYEAVGTKKKDGKTVPNCVPKKKASRPGAKAKFATEVGRKGNKSAMISRDATGTWYAYVVQRIETGIGKEEDMLGTMRSYSTEDRAKRAAIKALDTSGFSRPGAKAKA